jgi:hypothetical protein
MKRDLILGRLHLRGCGLRPEQSRIDWWLVRFCKANRIDIPDAGRVYRSHSRIKGLIASTTLDYEAQSQ